MELRVLPTADVSFSADGLSAWNNIRARVNAIARSGDYDTLGNYSIAVAALTESIGVAALNTQIIDTGSANYLSVRTNGVEQFRVYDVPGAINFWTAQGDPGTGGPSLQCDGSGTSIHGIIASKGISPIVIASNKSDKMFEFGPISNPANILYTLASITGDAFGPILRSFPVFTDVNVPITIGTTGSGSVYFATRSAAAIQVQIIDGGDGTNRIALRGTSSGGTPILQVSGTDTNVGLELLTQGTGELSFVTGGGTQLEILNTASATRNITITGSAAGNPTINVTGGNLTITPALRVSGVLSVVSSITLTANDTGIGFSVNNITINNSTDTTKVFTAGTLGLQVSGGATPAVATTGTMQAGGYLSSDGTAGLTQASTLTTAKSITVKNGLVTAFA